MPLVLGRIHRLIGFHVGVALAIAVGVETSAVQPCDFTSSCVSSNIFVFSQPTTWPPPLVHSVWFASSANIR